MGGFSLVGIPDNGMLAVIRKGIKNLKIVTNIATIGEWGIGLMLKNHQVAEVHASYVGENPVFERQYMKGEVSLHPIPQGSLLEQCRASVAGLGAVFVKAGVGTYVETGGFPMRFGPDGKSVVQVTRPRPKYVFDGKEYLLEEPIQVDFAMIKAYQGDKYGNLRMRKTARNFNPDMAGMGKVTIAEVEHIVDEIPADRIHVPGHLVDRVYQCETLYRKIERLRVRKAPGAKGKGKEAEKKEESKDARRNRIAKRAVQELEAGMYCNLGVGIPVLVANQIIGKVDVDLQGENGIVGMGPYPLPNEVDPDLINAGKETITEKIGHSHGSSTDAFGMMRGLHLHMTMIGGFQVSEKGDLANWIIPGHKVKGMGGAMDLVSCGSRVIVAMEHVGPGGKHKILKECNIPLTGKGVVSRLITDLVFDAWRGFVGCLRLRQERTGARGDSSRYNDRGDQEEHWRKRGRLSGPEEDEDRLTPPPCVSSSLPLSFQSGRGNAVHRVRGHDMWHRCQ